MFGWEPKRFRGNAEGVLASKRYPASPNSDVGKCRSNARAPLTINEILHGKTAITPETVLQLEPEALPGSRRRYSSTS